MDRKPVVFFLKEVYVVVVVGQRIRLFGMIRERTLFKVAKFKKISCKFNLKKNLVEEV